MSKYLSELINRVKASKISVTVLADETGLNERWIRNVLAEKVPNAPYEKIMTLENYLEKHIATMVSAQLRQTKRIE